MNVVIEPMPLGYRSIPAKFRPQHPPIFHGEGTPTDADVALARDLFQALDPESQAWYLRSGSGLFAGL